MFIIDDIKTAAAAGKAGLMIAGAALTFGLGFATCEAYEHTIPWGMGQQLQRLQDSIPGKIEKAQQDGAAFQARRDAEAFKKWDERLAQCEREKTTASKDAAGYLRTITSSGEKSRAAAYQLGRASCGASNAKTDHPVPGLGAADRGVPDDDQDLRSVLGGASYSPAPSPRRDGPPGR